MMGTAKGLVRDFLYRYVARYRRMVFLSLLPHARGGRIEDGPGLHP